MSEERQYVTNFTFPNGETYYVKDTEAREDIEELKKHGGGDAADAVLYTPQTLTDAQMEQARENIGAAAELPSGGTAGDFLRKTSSGVAWETVPAAESNNFGGGA